MSCNVCNLKLDPYTRSLPNGPEWFPNNEVWMVDYDEDNKEYSIVAGYDSGYVLLRIRDIKYCPKCGRKLGDKQTGRKYEHREYC